MPTIYPILAFSTVFNALTNIVTLVLVYKKDPKNIVNRTLAVFYFFIVLWSSAYFFPFTSHSQELTLLSFQLLHAAALFISVAHLHFVCAFLGVHKEKKWLILGAYLFNLAILPFVFTSWFIPEVVPKGPLYFYPNLGPIYHVWLAVWGALFLYSAYLEYQYYKVSTGIRRLQLKYLLLGNILTFGLGSTNFLLAYNIPFPPYPDAFASVHAILLAYIILKYRFLDFKLTFSNWVKLILAYAFALLVGLLVFNLFLFLQLPSWLSFALVSSIYLLSFLRIRSYFDSAHFYRIFQLTNTAHFKNVVDSFAAQNHFYEDLQELQKEVERIFCGQFKISAADIIVLNSHESHYPQLKAYFERNGGFLVTKEVMFQKETRGQSPAFYKELTGLGELCFPLFKSKKQLIGFFVLGQKPFDDLYTEQELHILESAAHYISLLLSAILYNVDLQREIKRQTKKLLEQNREIKKLYEIEKETTSILGHELKTPVAILSNVEWLFEQYVSTHKKSFVKHFNPLQDFSRKIKEAVIRINTMANSIFHLREVEYQMSMELQRLDWPRQLGQLLHHIEEMAKAKKLRFSTHFDLEEGVFYAACAQLEQVLTILLDNAVKYTSKGEVKLMVQQKRACLSIEVKDTGFGIPSEVRKRLFKKFSRGNHDTNIRGLGLGLYMAKKIMEQVGGSISLQKSSAQEGSIFIVKLPVHFSLTEN